MRCWLIPFLCAAAMLVTSGCTRSLRFGVIDADTRKPLPSVQLEWTKTTSGLLMGLLMDIREDTVIKTYSCEKYPIQIDLISRRGNHNFVFTAPGYQRTRFVFEQGKGWLLSPDDIHFTTSNFLPVTKPVVITSNFLPLTNPVVIPMQPAYRLNSTNDFAQPPAIRHDRR